MATANVYSASRSQAIEDSAIVDGSVVGDNLILTTHDGTPIDAGNVRGPQGLQGIQGIQGAPGQNSAYVVRASDPTANLTLSGLQTIDGVALAAGDRILAKNQTTPSQNGIYVVASGAWTRAADVDTPAEIGAIVVAIQQGTQHGGTRWVTTFKSTDTIGTTAMNWYRSFDNSNIVTFTSGGTTDASGNVTITHSLGWVPSQVLHSNGNPGASFAVLWGVQSITSTNFQARFMNGSTAGPLASLSIGVARWTCIR